MANVDLPSWHVLGDQVREEETLAPTGTGLKREYIVPYMIDSGPAKGSTQQIRVLPADFTPDQVRAEIEQHLAALHGVAMLGG